MSTAHVVPPADPMFDEARLAHQRLPDPLLRQHPERLRLQPAGMVRLVCSG
ncbi:MAG: hypothetical protein LC749_17830 [Actinobacteria bacterium]|nr:hypothetical protein [Actinomycetota bacterium]